MKTDSPSSLSLVVVKAGFSVTVFLVLIGSMVFAIRSRVECVAVPISTTEVTVPVPASAPKSLTAAKQRRLRRNLAAELHQKARATGLDMRVEDLEGRHPMMQVTWPLMTESWARELITKSYRNIDWNQTGFERVRFADGLVDGSYWDVDLRQFR